MPSNEQIIINAASRWKHHTSTENLVCEVRSLLAEIELYRDCLTAQRKIIDATIQALRDRGGK